jgi:hypothetical protein
LPAVREFKFSHKKNCVFTFPFYCLPKKTVALRSGHTVHTVSTASRYITKIFLKKLYRLPLRPSVSKYRQYTVACTFQTKKARAIKDWKWSFYPFSSFHDVICRETWSWVGQSFANFLGIMCTPRKKTEGKKGTI